MCINMAPPWLQSLSWRGTSMWLRTAACSWTTWSKTPPTPASREQCCYTSTSPSYRSTSASPTSHICSRWHAERLFMHRYSWLLTIEICSSLSAEFFQVHVPMWTFTANVPPQRTGHEVTSQHRHLIYYLNLWSWGSSNIHRTYRLSLIEAQRFVSILPPKGRSVFCFVF